MNDPLTRYLHDIAANIRKARKQADMTQVELGELIGSSKQQINRIERGTPLNIRTLVAISLALKTPIEDLLQSDRMPQLHQVVNHKNRKR